MCNCISLRAQSKGPVGLTRVTCIGPTQSQTFCKTCMCCTDGHETNTGSVVSPWTAHGPALLIFGQQAARRRNEEEGWACRQGSLGSGEESRSSSYASSNLHPHTQAAGPNLGHCSSLGCVCYLAGVALLGSLQFTALSGCHLLFKLGCSAASQLACCSPSYDWAVCHVHF